MHISNIHILYDNIVLFVYIIWYIYSIFPKVLNIMVHLLLFQSS